MKKVAAVAAPISLGTRLAEKTRTVANTLSDEERERLLLRGMQLIYGRRREKAPARRCCHERPPAPRGRRRNEQPLRGPECVGSHWPD
ncbi:MAG: hypothetical protein FJ387_24495 [Verrucomicrobia bacterium]|nr:hypothetical protein [Verrucomicrobiota bacterium]